ncbi:hypothetical protein C492_16543 [Natronococcus jeotgali DSM 18795]|uniref:Uncharacterized protein n=2 Tax=Natronococcus jeotgali TaxID=413812 RepID=L9WXK3_9EURY|nr:hypothetical protein C492_16543 [Natronococcus jeotgali DSM 18795]
MLPIQELRKIIEERGLGVRSRSSSELIDAILTDRWTVDEFDDLLDRIADIERETEPLGYYIADIESIEQLTSRDLDEELAERFLTEEVSFDDDNNLIDEGFEINNHSSNEIAATYWTQTINYTLDPLNELRPRKTLYDTGFRIDLKTNRVFIQTDIYGKARGLVSALEDKGLQLEEVGHQSVDNSYANDQVEEFVKELEEDLEEQRDQEQSSLVDSNIDLDVITIDTVKILVDGAEVKDVRIGGRSDIFTHKDVEHFINSRDGKIVQIEGEILYEGTYFAFQAGYNENLGRVKVRKKGGATGDIGLVFEFYNYLYEKYKHYFIVD